VSLARFTRHRRSMRAAALAGTVVLLGTPLILTPPAAAAPALTDHSVRVTVLSVTPSTPQASQTPRPLTVTLRLANTTDQSLDPVTVEGERGNPINSRSALDEAIANPKPADPSLVGMFQTTDKEPVTATLGPHATAVVKYRSSTDIPTDAGLCICHDAIYPLYFAVHTADVNGADIVVGSGQTYLPVFKDEPAPVHVSWVWPIIDRPHRLTDDNVFIDDELTASVTNGRLDRVLSVVEKAGKTVAMTLMVDPELIDELAVMSTGHYTYESGTTQLPGTGADAAKAWLARLRAALAANQGIELEFTPPSDPDVESLARNGLAWTVALSQQAQTRVTDALGGRAVTANVAWPAGGAISSDTLNTIVRQGARTVIVDEAILPGGLERSPAPNSLATLQTPAGPVFVGITSRRIQRLVSSVLSVGGAGMADLPKLVANVAIRAAEDPSTSGYVVIVPPREVDPSPVAATAIRDTASTLWSTSLGVGAATPPTVEPADHGQLVPPAPGLPKLPAVTINAAQNLTRMIPALSTMLSGPDATTLLGSLPAAVQRAESTAWRTDVDGVTTFDVRLNQKVFAIESGVQISKPSGGTYTLASRNAPLPLVIVNRLNVPVSVRVRVTSTNGLPGFTAGQVASQAIAPQQRLTLHIPTHVERTGRFVVQAALYTPSGEQIGAPVYLSVHSTALGTIGVIITIVAAGVLALALLVRLVRRLRHPTPAPGTEPPVIAP
jgi:hypothetical protein